MRPNNDAAILMTGATGFLGHFVLRELLRRRRRVVVLLRPRLQPSVDRLTAMMGELGVDLHEAVDSHLLDFVEGTLPDRLPDYCPADVGEILSCAASLQLFANGNGEPFNTNVRGTRMLLDWAARHRIRHIHAVSTAYVCGALADPVREVFHRRPPAFQTTYERSKWLAERCLARWGGQPDHVLTVFRPSFLVGDSRSGYTTQFGGVYLLARMIAILKERFRNGPNGELTYVPLRIPSRPNDRHNLVPVDFAAAVIGEVVATPDLHGRIYQLTDPAPPSNDFLKRCFEEYFRICGGRFVDSTDQLDSPTAAEANLWNGQDIVARRVAQCPEFHQPNTEGVMRSAGLAFPTLDRERIFRLLDYAVANRWGQGAGRKSTI